jgi:hypothetical protein
MYDDLLVENTLTRNQTGMANMHNWQFKTCLNSFDEIMIRIE